MVLYCRISGVVVSDDINHKAAGWFRRPSWVSLGVNSSQPDRDGHAIESQHVGGNAVIHTVCFSVLYDGVETLRHDLLKPLVDEPLVPEEPLAVLHPLKIGHRDAARIG